MQLNHGIMMDISLYTNKPFDDEFGCTISPAQDSWYKNSLRLYRKDSRYEESIG